jgi:hypothetical protein
MIKPYHNEYLVSSYPKRINILIDFIKMLEQNEEKKKIDVKGWLNQVEKSNGLMMPWIRRKFSSESFYYNTTFK